MRRRPSRLAVLGAALGSAAFPVHAAEVCTAFLEEHLHDPAWEKACLEELESLAAATPSSPSFLLQGGSLALAPDPPVNVSRPCPSSAAPEGCPDNQHEVFIAVDPGDPQRLFAISKSEPFGALFTARSGDGGGSWTAAFIADGSGPLPAGASDPWAVFDGLGNLYVAYLGLPGEDSLTHVARSTDGGATFSLLDTLPGDVAGEPDITDKPVMAIGPAGDLTGPGGEPAVAALWVLYRKTNLGVGNEVWVQGAAIGADGEVIPDFCESPPETPADAFCPPEMLAGSAFGGPGAIQTGDLAVGPDGEVVASYLLFDDLEGPSGLFFARDDDGLGAASGFADPSPAVPGADFTSNLGLAEPIAPHSRGATPWPNLAWDRDTTRSGPMGRLHLVYATEEPDGSDDTDVVHRYSDDAAATWTPDRSQPPLCVHPPCAQDADPGPVRSQFFGEVAVDPTTGT